MDHPSNPFRSPGQTSYRAPEPPEYEYYDPHRGALVLTLGIAGLVTALFSALICGPGMLLSLGLSLPAWVMGQNDLRAMREGTMDSQGYVQTQAGLICGVIAALMAALFLLILCLGGGLLILSLVLQ